MLPHGSSKHNAQVMASSYSRICCPTYQIIWNKITPLPLLLCTLALLSMCLWLPWASQALAAFILVPPYPCGEINWIKSEGQCDVPAHCIAGLNLIVLCRRKPRPPPMAKSSTEMGLGAEEAEPLSHQQW